uniref:Uncharacterized protein n=1 Tax=Arundo donax TaxID=35708 RepID=A0A0A9CPM1_ARUDO
MGGILCLLSQFTSSADKSTVKIDDKSTRTNDINSILFCTGWALISFRKKLLPMQLVLGFCLFQWVGGLRLDPQVKRKC